jgi:hypothetical protein
MLSSLERLDVALLTDSWICRTIQPAPQHLRDPAVHQSAMSLLYRLITIKFCSQCLKPFSTTFQLYHGSQVHWCVKLELIRRKQRRDMALWWTAGSLKCWGAGWIARQIQLSVKSATSSLSRLDNICSNFILFLCYPIMCLYILSSVLWCPLRYPHKNNVISALLLIRVYY